MVLDFFRRLSSAGPVESMEIIYCEKFVEFLIDLLSQLPTRRYTLPLVKDLNIIQVMRHSRLFESAKGSRLQDLSQLLQHFVQDSGSDGSDQTSAEEAAVRRYESFSRLQRQCIKQYPEKLTVLALSNYASVGNRADLQAYFAELSRSAIDA
ncbi:CWF11 family [Lasallia pustulata]|uniref:CWF11 family n=1 Tax=Lasallia pustulata TaxID=136370 RepID=A0A1W5D4D7_9LECA|nr:CWF11 family [Lasallia pustulata]